MSGACLISSNDSLWEASKNAGFSDDEAWAIQKIATNPKWRQKNIKKLHISYDGFPTLESVISILQKANNSELAFLRDANKMSRMLESKMSKQNSLQDAIIEVGQFNRDNPFREKYIAIPEKNAEGTYNIKVHPRNVNTENRLAELLTQSATSTKIVAALNVAGVPIEYIQATEELAEGDIELVQEGIFGIKKIKIASSNLEDGISKSDLSHKEAEAASTYILRVMRKHPLVRRLINKAEQDGIEAEKVLTEALLKGSNKNSLIKRLLATVVDVFKDVTNWKSRITRRNALKVAKGFLDFSLIEEYNDDVEKVEVSPNAQLAEDLHKKLLHAAKEFSRISPYYENKMKDILKDFDRMRKEAKSTDQAVISNALYLQSIGWLMYQLGEEFRGVTDRLNKINLDDLAQIDDNFVTVAKDIRGAREFCRKVLTITKLIESALPYEGNVNSATLIGSSDNSNIITLDNVGLIGQSINIKDYLNSMQNYITGSEGILNVIKTKEKQFAFKFLSEVMGEAGIVGVERILYSKGLNLKKRSRNKFVNGMSPVEHALNILERDNNWFEHLLTSMSNNPDLIGALADKVVKQMNSIADQQTTALQDELRVFKDRCEKAGVKDTDFFEVDQEGKVTGNILTEYNFAEWEKDQQEYKQQLKEKFLRENPDIMNASDFYRGVKLQEYLEEPMKQWHKTHSRYDSELQMFVPATSKNPRIYRSKKTGQIVIITPEKDYINDKYWQMKEKHPKKIELLEEYINIKKKIDNTFLPPHATRWYRMPQFKGVFIQRWLNRGFIGGAEAARSKILEQFVIDAEDYEFGSANTYNDINEDIFKDQEAIEEEKIHRLPLYGINKLKDMSLLSRDMYHNMLAYGAMAFSYNSLSQIADALETTKEVLSERYIKLQDDSNIEKNRDKHTRSYRRFTQYLEQHLYGIGMQRVTTRRIVWNKIAMLCSRLASTIWLGGNLQSALVNIGTGSIEVFKEAVVGEFFTPADWIWAHKYYFESLPANLMQAGKQDKDDKISLFIQMFNARGSNDDNFRNWQANRYQITELFWRRSLYLPYAVGDHYMQTIAFLCAAHNKKLYVKQGNVVKEVSLFDAYETVPLRPGRSKSRVLDSVWGGPKKLVLKGSTRQIDEKTKKEVFIQGKAFKEKNYVQEYEILESALTKLNRILAKEMTNVLLNQQELSLLEKYNIIDKNEGLDLEDTLGIKNLTIKIKDKMESMLWNDSDIGAFKLKIREVCNRMHGVYNEEDKVLLQTYILGNMFLSMRGYMLGLATRRFSRSHYNVALENYNEGSIITSVKDLHIAAMSLGGMIGMHGWNYSDFDSNPNLKTFLNCMLGFVLPVNTKALEKVGFMKDQIYNLRRNAADMWAIFLLYLAQIATGPDDDDEEEYVYDSAWDRAKGLAHYFSLRLFSEQAAFNGVGTAYELSSLGSGWSSIPGYAICRDVVEFCELGYYYFTHDPDQTLYTDEEYEEWKEIDKKARYQRKGSTFEAGDWKFLHKLYKMIPYWKFNYIWNDPYQSASSYIYWKEAGLKK